MGCVYAVNEATGERHLMYMECDFCDARLKPSPAVVDSGWVRRGVYFGPGSAHNSEVYLCPDCARMR